MTEVETAPPRLFGWVFIVVSDSCLDLHDGFLCLHPHLVIGTHLAPFCRSPISSGSFPLPSMTDVLTGRRKPSNSTESVSEDNQVPHGQRRSEAENCRALLGEREGRSRGWWGSPGQAFSPAQMVKHMQEYRSTRPWWSRSGLWTCKQWVGLEIAPVGAFTRDRKCYVSYQSSGSALCTLYWIRDVKTSSCLCSTSTDWWSDWSL